MDSLAKLQAELAEERQWREELQFLSIDQAVEIGKLREDGKRMMDRDPRVVLAELARRIEKLEAEVEQLVLGPRHTRDCACQACLRAYGPVDARQS